MLADMLVPHCASICVGSFAFAGARRALGRKALGIPVGEQLNLLQ
jgi:hypothetical protein